MTPAQLLAACRVPVSIPERRVGLWETVRWTVDALPNPVARAITAMNAGCRTWVTLHRDTMATLDRERGECVMDDTPRELRRHLPILLAARGRVLVSGLGLGCVVRGLLAKPEVTHIDVVEIDPAILALVGAHERPRWGDRVTLHQGDAETIAWPAGTRWDFAWHDVWSEHETLAVVHARLMVRYAPMVGLQGCWQFPREVKRVWPGALVNQQRRTAMARRRGAA